MKLARLRKIRKFTQWERVFNDSDTWLIGIGMHSWGLPLFIGNYGVGHYPVLVIQFLCFYAIKEY